MELIKRILKGGIPITNYLFNSIIVAIVDTAIVWILVRFSVMGLVQANTIGVVTGFLLHYLMSSKTVFRTEYSTPGFLIYLLTFFFGIGFANLLIYWSYTYAFNSYALDIRILLSKGVSVAVPFFVMYFMRKYLFRWLGRIKNKG